ncbi:hypothetical protein BDR07DRAFT_1454139 [Suillus spraguei]|nr:hypothetical protein BDR07DRAFT_1454139 [Suillus spraguei]
MALSEFLTRPELDRLELGERVMRKAIDLCSIYPGNALIPANLTTPKRPFSLKLDDSRLSNVMIDTGSEAATIAPLWECAVIPRWLQDTDDPESSYESGTSEERNLLHTTFLSAMEGEAYDMGRPLRRLTDLLCFQVNVWASNYQDIWVDERLEWAKAHPGIGLPETYG